MVEKKNDLKRIIAFPCGYGGCGHYRVRLPLYMIGCYDDIATDLTNMFLKDVSQYEYYTTVVFQRQCLAHQRKYFDNVLRFRSLTGSRLRLVYELDDCLHEIPESNGCHDFYNVENCANALYIMQNCDAVSFSTQPLQDYYEKLGVENSTVIRNTLPKFLWDFPDRNDVPTEKDTVKILWSGSGSHHGKGGDTDIFRYLMDKIWNKYGNRVKWIFQASKPSFVEDGPNVELIPWKSFWEYPRTLYGINADISTAPIRSNIFNECKSDLKLLENSACGTPCVCSDIGENGPYRKAPISVKNSPKRWFETICRLIEDKDFYRKIRAEQYKYISGRWMDSEEMVDKWKNFYLYNTNKNQGEL